MLISRGAANGGCIKVQDAVCALTCLCTQCRVVVEVQLAGGVVREALWVVSGCDEGCEDISPASAAL